MREWKKQNKLLNLPCSEVHVQVPFIATIKFHAIFITKLMFFVMALPKLEWEWFSQCEAFVLLL